MLAASMVASATAPIEAQPSKPPPFGPKPAPKPPAQPSPGAPAPAPPAAPASPAPKASAVPPAPVNPTPDAIAKAKAVFDAGGRAYEQGDFDAAIQAFEQAYSMSGRPSILFSLAQSRRKRFAETASASDRDAAIELYRAYLDQVKTGGRRADAQRGLESLGAGNVSGAPTTGTSAAPLARRTQLAIDSGTPGAMIAIDGGAPAPPQVMAEVAPGRHVVRVTAPGYVDRDFVTQAVEGQIIPETYELEEQPARIEVRLATGSTLYVDGRDMGRSTVVPLSSGRHFVSVTQNGHHAEGRSIELGPGEREQVAFSLRTTTQRDASIGLMIGGGVVVVGGGVLLGLAFLKQNEAENIQGKRDESSITQEELATFNRASNQRDLFRAGGVVFGGAGGLAVVIGAAMFLFDTPLPKQAPPDAPSSQKQPTAPTKKRELEMGSMSFVPWAGPTERGGAAFGGTWTGTF